MLLCLSFVSATAFKANGATSDGTQQTTASSYAADLYDSSTITPVVTDFRGRTYTSTGYVLPADSTAAGSTMVPGVHSAENNEFYFTDADGHLQRLFNGSQLTTISDKVTFTPNTVFSSTGITSGAATIVTDTGGRMYTIVTPNATGVDQTGLIPVTDLNGNQIVSKPNANVLLLQNITRPFMLITDNNAHLWKLQTPLTGDVAGTLKTYDMSTESNGITLQPNQLMTGSINPGAGSGSYYMSGNDGKLWFHNRTDGKWTNTGVTVPDKGLIYQYESMSIVDTASQAWKLAGKTATKITATGPSFSKGQVLQAATPGYAWTIFSDSKGQLYQTGDNTFTNLNITTIPHLLAMSTSRIASTDGTAFALEVKSSKLAVTPTGLYIKGDQTVNYSGTLPQSGDPAASWWQIAPYAAAAIAVAGAAVTMLEVRRHKI